MHYEPSTGEFTRLTGKRSGKKAGSLRPDGRRHVWVGGALYLEHRLAWLYMYGEWPTPYIDHIDGDPSNNRISNLRVATAVENQHNRGKESNRCGRACTSKYLGVYMYARVGRWVARINANGKRTFLGYFDNEIEAHAAYLDAKKTLHPFQPVPRAGLKEIIN